MAEHEIDLDDDALALAAGGARMPNSGPANVGGDIVNTSPPSISVTNFSSHYLDNVS